MREIAKAANQKGLEIYKRKGQHFVLNEGQQKLFDLMCRAFTRQETITKDKVFKIYKDHVATGRSKYVEWSASRKKNITRNVAWTEEVYQDNCDNWFWRSIASMVKKGALIAIPRIDFTTTKIEKLNGKA